VTTCIVSSLRSLAAPIIRIWLCQRSFDPVPGQRCAHTGPPSLWLTIHDLTERTAIRAANDQLRTTTIIPTSIKAMPAVRIAETGSPNSIAAPIVDSSNVRLLAIG
jgi:hypothetical protein